LTEAWFQLLQEHGAPRYTVEQVRGGLRAIHLDGAPFMTPVPAMFDYDLRLKTMNEHGVDVCIVSLTCPNCYWGGPDTSLEAARVHPTASPGVAAMDMQRFQLTASIGFTFDTSLAVARMIYDGFFDRYSRLKIIAAHGGGALPYLISRMDQCFDNIPACREKIADRPSMYLAQIYADAVVFAREVLVLC